VNTAQRIASHQKRATCAMFSMGSTSIAPAMLHQSPPCTPLSVLHKSGPGIAKPTTKAAWDTKVLDGLQDQPEDNYHAIMAMVRTAFERLKSGTADAKDFDRVASAFNVALVRAEAIDFRAVEVMQAGVAAMVECDGLQQRHRKYGFTGPGLVAANDAMNLYEDILRLSAPVLMEQAVGEVARRMLAQAQGVST